MYELIFWACLATAPDCGQYQALAHRYHVFTSLETREDCELMWKQLDAADPDPPGIKSKHICHALEQPL